MPTDVNGNLHGSVPDKADTALLIIDMIGEFAFLGADELLPAATEAARRIAILKRRAKARGIPTIYVNDNFGKWQSDFRKLVGMCLHTSCAGRPVAALLKPDEDDYFVLKPKHSGFYATPLDLLLAFLGARQLIVTGIATNSCILYTAADAYMRDFSLAVPADCTISATADDHRAALRHLKDMLKADIRPSEQLFASDLESTPRRV